jgi:hypothetical protein
METVTGPLIGWRREPSDHGIILVLQVVENREQARRKDFTHVNLALNDRQLRSLTRDLIRASESRGLSLASKPSWWTILRTTFRKMRSN